MEATIHCKYDTLADPRTLRDHHKNRNKHSDEQIERLAKLYGYHGVRHPIIVSSLSGCIVAGHGRKLAAIKAGIPEMPVVFQSFADESAEYAFIQADNAIALWADLDLAGINADLGDLGPDFDLEMLGIEDFTLDIAEKLEPGCDEDEVPEARPEPKVVRGEVYILGNHRLMCGDSTAITDVEKLSSGVEFDAVVTDPPYNVGKGYAGENLSADEFENLHRGWMSCATAKAKDDSAFYIYFGVKWLWLMANIVRDYINNPRLLVWYRPDGYGAGGGDFFYNFDPIFYGSKTGKFHTRKYDGEFNRDVWIVNKAKESEGGYQHPTSKPILVVEAAVLTSTNDGDNVLDLFGGSGSTLIACEKTNRNCFMMELDPIYCGVILDRWQKFTGKKAHREDGVAWDEIKGATA